MPADIDTLKAQLKSVWMDGDLEYFSRYMGPGTRAFFERIPLAAGARLLDVGCGSGELVRMAARAGAVATGVDIAVNLVERARARTSAEGLSATFREGDTEALPFEEASFDVVTSLIGAIFAPRPEVAAGELQRVCRSGGIIAMANWTPGSFIDHMLFAIAHYIAPGGMPSPMLWGDEATVKLRLAGASRIELSRQYFIFCYPFGPSDVVEFFRLYHGPMKRAFDSLDSSAGGSLRAELERLWSSHNRASGGGTEVHAEYLEVIATK